MHRAGTQGKDAQAQRHDRMEGSKRRKSLGRHDAALHLELLNGVHGGIDVNVAGAGIHVGTAVQHQVIGAAWASVDAETGDEHAAVAKAVRRLGVRPDVGGEYHERERAPAIQRQAGHTGVLDHFAHCRRRGIHQRRRAHHLDRFGHGADFELEIHPRLVANLHDDAGPQAALEALGFGRHGVAADGHSGHQIITGLVGGGRESGIGFGLGDADGGALNQGLLGIGDRPLNGRSAYLCPPGCGNRQGPQKQYEKS